MDEEGATKKAEKPEPESEDRGRKPRRSKKARQASMVSEGDLRRGGGE